MSIVLKPYADAAEMIQHSLQKQLAEKPVMLLLSAGSATELYRQLATSLELAFSPGRLLVSLLDERWDTDVRHADANDVAIRATGLIEKLESLGAQYHPVLSGAGLATDAGAFGAWLGEQTHGRRLVVLMGIGNDGHTAGMLPDDDADQFAARFDGEALAAGYQGPDQFAGRITTTLPLLRRADQAYLLAASAEKEVIVRQLLDQTREVALNQFPAKVIFEMQDVTILSTIGEDELL
jgi:6-phosphogluconolactonase/glucosamine-6-phosphate isomerase/deaminase